MKHYDYVKLKILANDNKMSLTEYLSFIINELFDLKYNSKIKGQ